MLILFIDDQLDDICFSLVETVLAKNISDIERIIKKAEKEGFKKQEKDKELLIKGKEIVEKLKMKQRIYVINSIA